MLSELHFQGVHEINAEWGERTQRNELAGNITITIMDIIHRPVFYWKSEVTLRLTISHSVCLGVGHPFGAHDQILLFLFFLRENCFAFRLGTPSLTRGRVYNL
jgi:hypothetical protein